MIYGYSSLRNLYVSSPILLPARFLNLKAEIGIPLANLHSFTSPSPPSLIFLSFIPFRTTMPASPHKIPPINVHLPGANAVISEIPVELTASPSSLSVDDEQLTVRSPSTNFHLSAHLCLLGSEPSIIPMRGNRSPCVFPLVVVASASAQYFTPWS